MGKNKGKPKVKNVFKVTGAKSLKIKAKAKAVNSQLKKINNVTKEKVVESNKQLQALEEAVRQTATYVTKPTVKNVAKDAQKTQHETDELNKITNESIDNIQAIKM